MSRRDFILLPAYTQPQGSGKSCRIDLAIPSSGFTLEIPDGGQWSYLRCANGGYYKIGNDVAEWLRDHMNALEMKGNQ